MRIQRPRTRSWFNKVMADNVTAHFQVLPKSSTFSGGKEVAGAWVEWRTPSFALAKREVQQGFFADATEIIHELSGGKQRRDHIDVNVVHASTAAGISTARR